jgi:hypothetical protein
VGGIKKRQKYRNQIEEDNRKRHKKAGMLDRINNEINLIR